MENDVSKESETYMYLAGGKRWVTDFGLFKHQIRESDTQTYKESDT